MHFPYHTFGMSLEDWDNDMGVLSQWDGKNKKIALLCTRGDCHLPIEKGQEYVELPASRIGKQYQHVICPRRSSVSK